MKGVQTHNINTCSKPKNTILLRGPWWDALFRRLVCLPQECNSAPFKYGCALLMLMSTTIDANSMLMTVSHNSKVRGQQQQPSQYGRVKTVPSRARATAKRAQSRRIRGGGVFACLLLLQPVALFGSNVLTSLQ